MSLPLRAPVAEVAFPWSLAPDAPMGDDRQRPWAALLGYDVTSVVGVGPKSSHYPQVTPLGGAECTDVAGWEPLVGPRRTR